MILEMRVFVDPALLRVEVPDLVLRPGMMLAARVAERSGQRGILMLAGHPLSAQLPDQVKAGDKLRLQVMEANSDRVVMKLVEESAAHQPDPTAASRSSWWTSARGRGGASAAPPPWRSPTARRPSARWTSGSPSRVARSWWA